MELYRKAFVDELLSQQAFGSRLEPLKTNGRRVWESAASANRLFAAPELTDETLPEIFRSGPLAARLSNIRRAIHLAKRRAQNKEPLERLAKQYIGAAGKPETTSPADARVAPNEASLRDQIDLIRRAVRSLHRVGGCDLPIQKQTIKRRPRKTIKNELTLIHTSLNWRREARASQLEFMRRRRPHPGTWSALGS